MAYEHRPGQISLFRNDFKKDDRHPDWKGRGKDLNGKDIEVAAWTKRDGNGNTFLSVQISLPRDSTAAILRGAAATAAHEHDPGENRPPMREYKPDLPF